MKLIKTKRINKILKQVFINYSIVCTHKIPSPYIIKSSIPTPFTGFYQISPYYEFLYNNLILKKKPLPVKFLHDMFDWFSADLKKICRDLEKTESLLQYFDFDEETRFGLPLIFDITFLV